MFRRLASLAFVSSLCLASASLFAQVAVAAANPLAAYAAASPESRAILKKASDLAGEGKWKSAYASLLAFDAQNGDPYVLAMKTDFAVHGSVRNTLGRSFAFADLENGQSLSSLRASPGSYDNQSLDPPALAAALAAKGKTNPPILSKELGDYYCDVFVRFQGHWTLGDGEILDHAIAEYAKAWDAGVYDALSLRNYAEALMRQHRDADSEAVYRKAVELDPSDAYLRYSFAASLSLRKLYPKALEQIDAALTAYHGSPSEIDALALGARCASAVGDKAKAEGYFQRADKDFPGTATADMMRQMIAVETGDRKAANEAADRAVAAHGDNPGVVRALVTTWFAAGQVSEARSFLDRAIAKGPDNLSLGSLEFFKAVLLAQGKPSDADRKEALACLDIAETKLKAGLASGDDGGVFKAIEGLRASLSSTGR